MAAWLIYPLPCATGAGHSLEELWKIAMRVNTCMFLLGIVSCDIQCHRGANKIDVRSIPGEHASISRESRTSTLGLQ